MPLDTPPHGIWWRWNSYQCQNWFSAGMGVNKEDNLVYLEVRPVKQTVRKIIRMKTVIPLLNPSVLLLPGKWAWTLANESVCSHHETYYSMELNARTFRQPEKIAFVGITSIRRNAGRNRPKLRKNARGSCQTPGGTGNQPFPGKCESPRNWQYWKRVAEGSQDISLIMHMTMVVIPGSASVS